MHNDNYPVQDLYLSSFDFSVYSGSWNGYINLKFPVSTFRPRFSRMEP